MPNKTQNNLVRRSPIVVVMGHIDHGKSTLLDYIRKANIVAGEAGGITQHVGAYEAEQVGADGVKRTFTFLDTPGHEAFCSIRERGAQAADVAILVVSAEDGVKPQTVEALREIKAANIPYIVAINKIDKPNADIDKTKQSLGENEIYVEGWGGDIPCVAISALTGAGITELLDMVNLVSELSDLSADNSKSASGVVIESELDTRKGISATLLIKDGTLESGVFVVAGTAFAPVRYIENFKGEKIETAQASRPVVVVGWTEIPGCGTIFVTVKTKKIAEEMVEEARRAALLVKKPVKPVAAAKPIKQEFGKNGLMQNAPEIVVIPLIVKADVIGSLDGVKHELAKIKNEKVEVKIVAEGIGEINENDVKMAIGDPNILIVGFNENPNKKAQAVIERSAVPINVKSFKIIYELTQFIKDLVVSKVPKEYIEEITGRAKIAAVFSKEKDKQVVGGKVQEGTLAVGSSVRIMRRESEIGRGLIRELQQQKKRVKEVAEGYEFGTLIESKTEIAAGDKVECVRMIEKNG